MTCRETLGFLGDFVDNTLSVTQAGEIAKHLEHCSTCRKEYKATKSLQGLMGRINSPEPGPDYWQDTTDIILARTVGSITSPKQKVTGKDKTGTNHQAFIRSLVSVAASLVILFSAIFLGKSENYPSAELTNPENPFLVVAPLQEMFYDKKITVATTAERVRIQKGTLLIGAPGFLGKLTLLTNPIIPLDETP